MERNLNARDETQRQLRLRVANAIPEDNNGFPVISAEVLDKRREVEKAFDPLFHQLCERMRSPNSLALHTFVFTCNIMLTNFDLYIRIRRYVPLVIESMSPSKEFRVEALNSLYKIYKVGSTGDELQPLEERLAHMGISVFP